MVCVVCYNLLVVLLSTGSTDLWSLPNDRLTAAITDEVEVNFFSRCEPKTRPLFLRESKIVQSDKVETQWGVPDMENDIPAEVPRLRRWWFREGSDEQKVTYDASLVRALHKTFFLRIWMAGILNLCSGVSAFYIPFPY